MADNKNIQLSLFPDDYEETRKQEIEEQSGKNQIAQKHRFFGLEYCNDALFCGKYGIPLLNSYTDSIPENYVTFSETTLVGDPYSCVTSYDQDYVIDRMWNHPDRYVKRLSKYMCFAEPDYSLKVNHPLSVQIANTYRSHAIAYYMQDHGIKVLPSMAWSSTMSHEFCFDGHSKGGVVMVSTIGTLKDERSRMYFRLGFMEMLKRIAPDAVILYGDINDKILSWMPKQLDVHYKEHKRYKRARNHGK
ncbi:MAG: DUF4417 domain-containing protein [Prevotella sp.]|nr:DUF4417 domain-containing protein [Prevotella sp.]